MHHPLTKLTVFAVAACALGAAHAQGPIPPYEESHHSVPDSYSSMAATDSAGGIGTAGTVVRAGDTTIMNVLAPQARPRSAVKSEGAVLQEVGSLLRYERREFNDSEVNYDRYGGTAFGSLSLAENLPLDIALPVDRYNFNTAGRDYDNTSVGLVLTPRYYFMNQAQDGVDLGAGVNTFYYHAFADESDVDDLDTIGGGPLLCARKDFESFFLSGGVMMDRGWNMHSQTEVTGDNYVDAYRGALNVGVPLGDDWVVNLTGIYTYLDDMPSDLDDSFFSVGPGVTWALNKDWMLDFTVMTDVENSDSNNLLAMVGMIWNY